MINTLTKRTGNTYDLVIKFTFSLGHKAGNILYVSQVNATVLIIYNMLLNHNLKTRIKYTYSVTPAS